MKILHTGKFLRLVQEGTWEYVQRVNCHGIAVLVPVTDDQKIVLVEQFRISLHKNVIELPAGLIGDVDANESCLPEPPESLKKKQDTVLMF